MANYQNTRRYRSNLCSDSQYMINGAWNKIDLLSPRITLMSVRQEAELPKIQYQNHIRSQIQSHPSFVQSIA